MLYNLPEDQTQNTKYYNLDAPWAGMNVDPKEIGFKTAPAAYGMSPLMSYSEIENYYRNDDETSLRQYASAKANIESRDSTVDMFRQGMISDLSQITQPYSPTSVLEKKFGQAVMNNYDRNTDGDDDTGTYSEIVKANPMLAAAYKQLGRNNAALRMKIQQELEASNKALDSSKSEIFTPFWYAFKDLAGVTSLYTERGVVPGTFMEGGALGSNIKAGRDKIFQMPVDQALETLDNAGKYLRNANPGAAVHFFSSLLQPSALRQQLDDSFNLLDIATVPQVGTSLVKNLLFKREVNRMTAETLQRVPEMLNGGNMNVLGPSIVGDSRKAGVNKVADDLSKQMVGNLDPTEQTKQGLMSIMETLPNDIAKGGPGKDGNAAYNIVLEDAQRTGLNLVSMAQTVAKATGLTDVLALEKVADDTLTKAVASRPFLYDRIGNVLPIQIDQYTGNRFADLVIMNHDGSMASSVDKMVNVFEDELGLPVSNIHGFDVTAKEGLTGSGIRAVTSSEIKGAPIRNVKGQFTGVYSEGKGFYGTVRVPITDNMLKDAVVELPSAQNSNKGFLNQIGLGRFRTPEEVLSERINTQRKLGVYAQGLLQKMIYKTEAPTRAAKRADFDKSFTRALKNGQLKQVWYNNIPEFEQYYIEAEGRLPTAVETRGYFAYRNGYQMDTAFRNLAATKHMNNQGVERHVFFTVGEDGLPNKSEEILGSVINKLPEFRDEKVLFKKGNDWVLRNASQLSVEDKELLRGVESGKLKGIKLWNPEMFPMNDYAGLKPRAYVTHVITDQAETRPLGMFRLPEKPGGHLEYNYSHYLKFADIAKDENNSFYLGDRTAMALESRAVGNKVAQHLNAIREALKEGGREGIAKAKLEAKNLPIEWRDIRNKFKSGEWDMEQKFHVVPAGKTVADIPGALNGAKDTFYGGSPANQFRTSFVGDRDPYDVFAMHSQGVVHNPQLSYRKADTIDPYASMNRALTRIINSTYMDDIKINSVNEWLTKYGGKLDWNPRKIQSNPYQAFVHGKLDSTMPLYEKNQIEAERYQIKAFHNIPSTQDSWVQGLEQFLIDKTFSGEGPIKRSSAALGKYVFDTAMATPAVLRYYAFKSGLGLFNPGAFATQLGSFLNLFAIGGLEAATKGTMASMLHQVSRLPMITEKHLKDLDKLATRFGWKPGDWLEARQAMIDHGYDLVSTESNILRTTASRHPDKLFQSTLGTVLDAGDIFFNEGERWSRYGSWYTAWNGQAKKSVDKISLLDRQKVLNTADMLLGNMSQASRSSLQNGLGSLPTQFLGYWLRMSELMTGSRLTTVQKARMFGAYSLLYGAPSGLAITGVGGLLSPFEENINKYAADKGWLPENSKVSQVFFQGLTSAMLSVITGKDYAAGTKFGVGPGRGVDIFSNDTSLWRIFTGPVGDMLMQTYQNFDPLVRSAYGIISQNESRRYTVAEDWLKPLTVVSSANAVTRWWNAIKYHEWRTRNENTILSDVGPIDATVMTLLGLQPQASDTMQLMHSAGDVNAKEEKRLEKQFNLDQSRYYRAISNDEFSTADVHYRNMNVTADQYPVELRHQLWAQAQAANWKSMPERTKWNYYMGRHRQPKDVKSLTETYQKMQENGR
jgi:hypothetical protein